MNEQYREWIPLVVVIPIVWESCVWLRPVRVVSIARESRFVEENESAACVGVFLSYRVFSHCFPMHGLGHARLCCASTQFPFIYPTSDTFAAFSMLLFAHLGKYVSVIEG